MSLGSLFQTWIKQQAKNRGWQAAVDAAKRNAQANSTAKNSTAGADTKQTFNAGQAADQSGGIPHPNLPPCHVGIVYALPIEAGAWEKRLTGMISIRGAKWTMRQGGRKGKSIIVIHCGVGHDNAAEATAALIAGHKPKWVISAGLAGGLQPNLARGDIVMPDAILGEDGRRLTIDLSLPSNRSAGTSSLHTGALLTIDHIAFRAAEKRQLGQRYGAVACDMETLGVAEACRCEQQRFLAVRVISDTMDEELPADVEHLVKQTKMGRRIGAAAGTVLRRPSVVKELWRVREAALVASERLASFLEGVIDQL